MTHSTRLSVAVRSCLGLVVSAGVLLLLRAVIESALGPGGWHGLTSPGRRPDEVLVVLLATAATALAAWLALGCALALLSAAPGAVGWWSARVAARLTPGLVRKLLTVALTTSTASLLLPTATVVASAAPSGTGRAAVTADDRAEADTAAPSTPGPGFRVTGASAAEPHPPTPAYIVTTAPTPSPTTTTEPASVQAPTPNPVEAPTAPSTRTAMSATTAPPSPGFRPSAPVRAHDPSSSDLLTRSPRPATALLEAVTVRRGDTLWAIAARHLDADAGDAEIAREWPRWYAANRTVIGADPDLIQPGTQLVPPREGDLR